MSQFAPAALYTECPKGHEETFCISFHGERQRFYVLTDTAKSFGFCRDSDTRASISRARGRFRSEFPFSAPDECEDICFDRPMKEAEEGQPYLD